jgi:hypothetical protein|tara:strand:+ start:483 stop:779 length:297 start_codon:yes stop_codon:yes gene_type:complete
MVVNVPMPFRFKLKAEMKDCDVEFDDIEVIDLEPFWLSMKECIQEYIQEGVQHSRDWVLEDLKRKIQIEFETKFYEEEEAIAEENEVQTKLDRMEEYA